MINKETEYNTKNITSNKDCSVIIMSIPISNTNFLTLDSDFNLKNNNILNELYSQGLEPNSNTNSSFLNSISLENVSKKKYIEHVGSNSVQSNLLFTSYKLIQKISFLKYLSLRLYNYILRSQFEVLKIIQTIRNELFNIYKTRNNLEEMNQAEARKLMQSDFLTLYLTGFMNTSMENFFDKILEKDTFFKIVNKINQNFIIIKEMINENIKMAFETMINSVSLLNQYRNNLVNLNTFNDDLLNKIDFRNYSNNAYEDLFNDDLGNITSEILDFIINISFSIENTQLNFNNLFSYFYKIAINNFNKTYSNIDNLSLYLSIYYYNEEFLLNFIENEGYYCSEISYLLGQPTNTINKFCLGFEKTNSYLKEALTNNTIKQLNLSNFEAASLNIKSNIEEFRSDLQKSKSRSKQKAKDNELEKYKQNSDDSLNTFKPSISEKEKTKLISNIKIIGKSEIENVICNISETNSLFSNKSFMNLLNQNINLKNSIEAVLVKDEANKTDYKIEKINLPIKLPLILSRVNAIINKPVKNYREYNKLFIKENNHFSLTNNYTNSKDNYDESAESHSFPFNLNTEFDFNILNIINSKLTEIKNYIDTSLELPINKNSVTKIKHCYYKSSVSILIEISRRYLFIFSLSFSNTSKDSHDKENNNIFKLFFVSTQSNNFVSIDFHLIKNEELVLLLSSHENDCNSSQSLNLISSNIKELDDIYSFTESLNKTSNNLRNDNNFIYPQILEIHRFNSVICSKNSYLNANNTNSICIVDKDNKDILIADLLE